MTNAAWNGPVTMEDVPEEFREVAEALGMKAFLKIITLCGGQDLYIPKRESLERGPRDRAIRAQIGRASCRERV